MRHHLVLTWLLALTLPLSPGCGHDHEHGDHGHSHDHDHDHAHSAKNGGSLVVLAEEFAHMEVLVDAEAGQVTAWSLGPHCENYEKLAQPTIDLTVAVEGGEPFTLTLDAQYSQMSSDEEGSSSWFAATDERLVGLDAFDGTFGAITSRGRTFESTAFPYPEGNDERAAHDHDHEH